MQRIHFSTFYSVWHIKNLCIYLLIRCKIMSRLQFKCLFIYQETGNNLSFIRMNGLNVLIFKRYNYKEDINRNLQQVKLGMWEPREIIFWRTWKTEFLRTFILFYNERQKMMWSHCWGWIGYIIRYLQFKMRVKRTWAECVTASNACQVKSSW